MGTIITPVLQMGLQAVGFDGVKAVSRAYTACHSTEMTSNTLQFTNVLSVFIYIFWTSLQLSKVVGMIVHIL